MVRESSDLSKRGALICVGIALAGGILAWLYAGFADRNRILNELIPGSKLSQIFVALLAYREVHGAWLPASSTDRVERSTSWRVTLLATTLGKGGGEGPDNEIARQYRSDLPWDDVTNLAVLFASPHAPGWYRVDDANGYDTQILAISGKGTAWETLTNGRVAPDGLHGKILLIFLKDSHVPWTKPVDLSAEDAIRILTSRPGVIVMMADGTPRVVERKLSPREAFSMVCVDDQSE